jgi:hypothetical protein
MGFESIESKMKHLSLQNESKTDIINGKSQERIGAAASSITKGLQTHDPFEWRVKKIYQWQEQVPCSMNLLSHRLAKVTMRFVFSQLKQSNDPC